MGVVTYIYGMKKRRIILEIWSFLLLLKEEKKKLFFMQSSSPSTSFEKNLVFMRFYAKFIRLYRSWMVLFDP